jgi:uridine kinase
MNVVRKAVVVGISGCSSSGKTTLSRLLRDIFPNTFVLHEDDFYRPETEWVFLIWKNRLAFENAFPCLGVSLARGQQDTKDKPQVKSTANHMTRSLPRPLSILKTLVLSFIPQTDSIALTRPRLPKKDGLLDWDCAEALNISNITKSLAYIQKTGTFPVSQQHLYQRFRF